MGASFLYNDCIAAPLAQCATPITTDAPDAVQRQVQTSISNESKGTMLELRRSS